MYTDHAFTCCNIDVNEFRSFKLTPSVKSAKAKFYVLYHQKDFLERCGIKVLTVPLFNFSCTLTTVP